MTFIRFTLLCLRAIIRRKFNCSCICFDGWYHDSSQILVLDGNEYDSVMVNWKLNGPWLPYCAYDFSVWTRKAYVISELKVKRWKLQTFSWVDCQFKTPGFYSCHIFTCRLHKIFWVVTASLSQCRSACVFIYCSDQRPKHFLKYILCNILFVYSVVDEIFN